MFTHNLATQVTKTNSAFNSIVFVAIVLTIAFFVLMQTNWIKPEVEQMVEINKVEHESKLVEQNNAFTKQAVDQCEKHQNKYQLLGVLVNGERMVTLVKHNLTEQNEIISNFDTKTNGLNLISAKLKQAMYQVGECRFNLRIVSHQQAE